MVLASSACWSGPRVSRDLVGAERVPDPYEDPGVLDVLLSRLRSEVELDFRRVATLSYEVEDLFSDAVSGVG